MSVAVAEVEVGLGLSIFLSLVDVVTYEIGASEE